MTDVSMIGESPKDKNVVGFPSEHPADLDVRSARLPETYENAKTALATCERLDECRDWSNKAEALASYAKMADDDTLATMAMRIKARAIRRCGELLKRVDGRPHNAKKQSTAADTLISQKALAARAGMSKRQKDTAIRVALVPQAEFEQAIETEQPATVTKLAEMGKSELYRPKPDGFAEATQVIGEVNRFSELCGKYQPCFIANGMDDWEAKELLAEIGTISNWLGRFSNALSAREVRS